MWHCDEETRKNDLSEDAYRFSYRRQKNGRRNFEDKIWIEIRVAEILKLITSENCLKNSKEYNSAVCMHETKGSERNGRDFGEQMESVKCRKREASVKSERHSHQAWDRRQTIPLTRWFVCVTQAFFVGIVRVGLSFSNILSSFFKHVQINNIRRFKLSRSRKIN